MAEADEFKFGIRLPRPITRTYCEGKVGMPILMTEDMHKAVSAMIDTREKCGVLSINRYIFAIPHLKHSHLDFFGTLRRVAHKVGLKRPHLLTTTQMCKHLATMGLGYSWCYECFWWIMVVVKLSLL